MALMSMRAYAKHRGVSVEAVSKAVKRSRISTVADEKGNRKIDSEVADREWVSNREEAQVREFGVEKDQVPEVDAEKGSKVAENYRSARAVRENFAARLAKLDFDERSGRLVSAEDVKAEAFRIARFVRDSMLNIPDRLSSELAAETDAFKINQRLTEEIRKALEMLKIDPVDLGNT